MKGSFAVGPVLVGYGFVILGVLIAAYCTRREAFFQGFSRPGAPFKAMFLTGLWVGLVLGGLGSIFYVSPLTGLITLGILIVARFVIKRGKNKELVKPESG